MYGLTPIEDDGANAALGEPERAEETGRTAPDDDHGTFSFGQRPEPRRRDGGGSSWAILVVEKDTRMELKLRPRPARVDCFAQHLDRGNPLDVDP